MKTHRAYWTCQILGWGSYSAFGAWMGASREGWSAEILIGYGLYFLYSIPISDQLRRFVKRRGWLETEDRPRYLQIFLAAGITGLVQAALVIGIDLLMVRRKTDFLNPGTIGIVIAGIAGVTIGWMVVYLAVTSGRRYREKQLALREAELRSLESQINPHFLFNSLNSIRGLVIENPPLAQDLITRLANILRYNLHRDAGHTVPLESELEAAADYLALESARYEERLQVRFAIAPDTRSIAVPPMLLQTLVENAVKHGIAVLPAGGELVVASALDDGALVLRVENPGAIAAAESARPRLGLENIRQRLRILYGDRAALDLSNGAGRVTATVRIPRDR